MSNRSWVAGLECKKCKSKTRLKKEQRDAFFSVKVACRTCGNEVGNSLNDFATSRAFAKLFKAVFKVEGA